MLIDELLLVMPYQFVVSKSEEDYFELLPKPNIEAEQIADSSPVGPKDRITAEIFSTKDESNFEAMRKYRRDHLKIPDGSKAVCIDEDEDGDFPFCIYVYRVDDSVRNERKLYFLKTGVTEKYRYSAMILIHKEITETSGITTSDLISWPGILKEHITGDPYYKDMHA